MAGSDPLLIQLDPFVKPLDGTTAIRSTWSDPFHDSHGPGSAGAGTWKTTCSAACGTSQVEGRGAAGLMFQANYHLQL